MRPSLRAIGRRRSIAFAPFSIVGRRLLAERGRIDLTDRRNRLLRRTAERWADDPPTGFTVAAGITTAAPAIAAVLARVARMPDGMVVLPGLSLAELDAGRGVGGAWPRRARPGGGNPSAISSEAPARPDRRRARRSPALAIAGQKRVAGGADAGDRACDDRGGLQRQMECAAAARSAPDRHPRRGTARPGGGSAGDCAGDARGARDAGADGRAGHSGPFAGAARVGAARRAGVSRPTTAPVGRCRSLPPGTLLLAIASAAAEDLAPVPLLALLKHPLVGGEGEERRRWMDDVRLLDLALRGPRPAGGIAGIDTHLSTPKGGGRAGVAPHPAKLGWPREADVGCDRWPIWQRRWSPLRRPLAGDRAWSGAAGRAAADLLSRVQGLGPSGPPVTADDAVPILRQLLHEVRVRPPYGGHPRVFIWGLLEARLQQADLMILGGLNEGVWPALPAPDPWLAPKIRANLGLPGPGVSRRPFGPRLCECARSAAGAHHARAAR